MELQLNIYWEIDKFSEPLYEVTRWQVKYMMRCEKKWIPKKVIYEDVEYDQLHNENVFTCICPSCGLHIITFYDSE